LTYPTPTDTTAAAGPAGTGATPAPGHLPPVAPQVTAAAVEELSPRLRKRLDATVERLATATVSVTDEVVRVDCGAEAVVVLTPGASGALTDPDQARCSCLLAPRCLHRAAVLTACPVADTVADPVPDPAPAADVDPASGPAEGSTPSPASAAGSPGAGSSGAAPPGAGRIAGSAADPATGTPSTPDGAAGGRTRRGAGPTKAQRAAATALWEAAVAVLAAGVPAAGAVPQAELLRAAHGARLAGLPRAESAALRTVRGLRAARSRQNGHRLADLVEVLHDLLLVAGRLAAGDPDPALIGVVRRAYQPDGTLEVYGVCREPVISATGYAGVVTHLVAADGRRLSFADVKPGGPNRARDCGNAVTEMGAVAVNHAVLARGGLRITGTTVSPDGRLGAGKGVRATPLTGAGWSTGPLAELFARRLADAVSAQLAADSDPEAPAGAGTDLIGCDLMVVGASGDQVLARELAPARTGPVDPAVADGHGGSRSVTPGGPVIRLAPASAHPTLAHLTNLRRLASWPGLWIRVVGRLDPERASTLRPLAVGPVPGAGPTLRLPERWEGRADLGYDQLQGGNLPPRDRTLMAEPVTAVGPDPVAESPLWRVRRLVELAVSGGRRAVGEAARGDGSGSVTPLRRAGFQVAAALAAALADESDRAGRDAFGRRTDPDPDRYAWAWVTAATHLAATERELVRVSWSDPPAS
jgi:hypothetical protein